MKIKMGPSILSFKEQKKSKNTLKYSCLMWPELESNQRHKDFQSSALPTELSGHKEEKRHLKVIDLFSATLISYIDEKCFPVSL